MYVGGWEILAMHRAAVKVEEKSWDFPVGDALKARLVQQVIWQVFWQVIWQVI